MPRKSTSFAANVITPPAANGNAADWNYARNVRHQPVCLSQALEVIHRFGTRSDRNRPFQAVRIALLS